MPSREGRSINARPGLHRSARATVRLTWLAVRAAPVQMAAITVILVLTSLAVPLRAVSLGLLTEGVFRHRQGLVLVGLVVLVVQLLAGDWLSWVGLGQRMGLRERVGRALGSEIIDLTLGIPDIEHLENPAFHDELRVLEQYRGQVASLPDAVVSVIGALVSVIATAGVLASVDPWLLTLPLFGLPAALNGGRAEQRRQDVIERTAQRRRFLNGYFELATDPAALKEVRLFGLAERLRGRHAQTHDDVNHVYAQVQRKNALSGALAWSIFGLGFGLAVALVTARVVHHQSNVGQLVVTLSLGTQVSTLVSATVGLTSWLVAAARNGARFLWLSDYASGRREALREGRPQRAAPERLAMGITFERVSFAYPGVSEMALRDVSLQLPAGSTVALVGDNGAGKTTLIKLLCRLYEPTSGAIALDDLSLAEIAPSDWRTRISAGFQDFARLELVARETVLLGEPGVSSSDELVLAALGRAHAGELVDQLPNGLDSQLGTRFPGGIDLSGGQWQKVALGRTMMRPAPLLLLLDEPTSALDATTEHLLFTRYLSAAKAAAAASGAVTILVSHRFSTVRSADLIVVVRDGRIVEVGDHLSLIASGGMYSELYELQARGYR